MTNKELLINMHQACMEMGRAYHDGNKKLVEYWEKMFGIYEEQLNKTKNNDRI